MRRRYRHRSQDRLRYGVGVDEIRPGLEGVIAFETTIAEPDKEGGALRYRGVDIEELVGHYPFEKVWGLLVDENFEPGMPHAEHIELQDPSGSVMADLQAGLATLGPKWGLKQIVDIEPEQTRDDLGRLSAAALSIVAQAARGAAPVVPESEVEQGENAAAPFMIRWRARPIRSTAPPSTRNWSPAPSTASTPRPSTPASPPPPAPNRRLRRRPRAV